MTDAPLLIDASAWLPYLRGAADPPVVMAIHEWLASDRAATTEIIRVELLQTSRTEEEFERLRRTLDGLTLLPIDTGAWIAAAYNGFTLRSTGLVVPTATLLVATVAQQTGATVCHLDPDYEHIAPVLGLQTQSMV
jgi:predicted nucleic acid-binding protein